MVATPPAPLAQGESISVPEATLIQGRVGVRLADTAALLLITTFDYGDFP